MRHLEHDNVADSRAFLTGAINRTIDRGELILHTADPATVVEMLLTALWGMGFYAGFVEGREALESITNQLLRLLVGDLWEISNLNGT
jgi:TetR/AcrR family transcriptional regulator, repressor for uid operon